MEGIDIPAGWQDLAALKWEGLLMLIGESDAGKSTLARWLLKRQAEQGRPAALLDGDPGQSSLGPPATMTLALPEGPASSPTGGLSRWFVGATSPVRHMLPVLTGAARLAEAARLAGVPVIHDTTGLVRPEGGGCTLKWAKIDLLRPSVVVALQRAGELEYLLAPLRRRRLRLIEIGPSPAVAPRNPDQRREHRARQFADYFAAIRSLAVAWTDLAVYPDPSLFAPNRLVALENQAGFTSGLGIVLGQDEKKRHLLLRTPVASLTGVETLRIGDLLVDPVTFRDQAR